VTVALLLDPAAAAASESAARRDRRLAATLLVVGLVLAVAGVAYYRSRWTGFATAAAALGLVWLLVGFAAVRVRPAARLGLLMMGVGVCYLFADSAIAVGGTALWARVLSPAGGVVGYVATIMLLHICLTYPSGRSPDRATAILIRVLYVVMAVSAVAVLLTLPPPAQVRPRLCVERECTEPLFPFGADPQIRRTVRHIVAAAWGLLWLTSLVFILTRFFTAGPRERRLRGLPTWAMAAAALVALATTFVPAAVRGVGMFSLGPLALLLPMRIAYLVALPLVFLAGLLRERLDLARVSDLLPQLATVPVARLRPALAAVLGDPKVDLVLAAGRGPPNMLPTPVPLTDRSRRTTPLGDPSRPVGQLIHDRTLLDEPRLIEAVRAAVSLAIDHERLQAEVRQHLQEIRDSRTRLVEAGDNARRRLERDLHDGAQQRLIAIGLLLQAARQSAGTAMPTVADSMLREAETEVRAAIEELRELARGIHPAVLTEQGLLPALHQLAARAPDPVDVRPTKAPRLSTQVESTVYFLVSEALANVAKHAHATRATVTVDIRDGQVTAVVSDDGRGGATLRPGSGLEGIADRVAAIGGTLRLHSKSGSGTSVTAELPRY
jgi:signal transduction histidine kinase